MTSLLTCGRLVFVFIKWQLLISRRQSKIINIVIIKFILGSGPIPFLPNQWKKFDFNNLRNLIESCLKIDPNERITAEDALNHPWFES